MVQEQTLTPDMALIQQAARGDNDAFTELFDRHYQKVFNYAYWLCGNETLAEDLTQEAFTRAYERIAQFGPPWKLRTWLYRLARNLFYDHTHEQSPILSLDPNAPVASKDTGPELTISKAEGREFVQQVIEALPDPHREILILREFDQLSYEDIAQTMDISLSYVRVLLHRARGNFQQIYQMSLLADDRTPPCEELNELLDAYHDGEGLTESERKAVRQHLSECETCQKRQRELVALSSALALLPPLMPPSSLADGFRLKMRRSARTPLSGRKNRRWSTTRILIAGSLVAGLVVAGTAGAAWLVFSNPTPPGPGDPAQPDKDDGEDTIEALPDSCDGDDCLPPEEEAQDEGQDGCEVADCDPDNQQVQSVGTLGPPTLDISFPGVCQLSESCGDGICDPTCENSDLCNSDCQCVDDGLCLPGEGVNCKDCGGSAGSCGSACIDSIQCAAGLTCANGVCWDAATCGGSSGGGSGGGGDGDPCPCVWSDPCSGGVGSCPGYYNCRGRTCTP